MKTGRVWTKGVAAMQEWMRRHPERWRELNREAVEYSWRTNPRRREHLAAVRVRGTAAMKRDIPWQTVAELRKQGLSWRRIRAVTGIPHSTLIGRQRELTQWL